jgi:signal transduction histidine kinase
VNVSHRIATRTETISNLVLALVLAAVLAADATVTAARHDNWRFELAVGAVVGALALCRGRNRLWAAAAGLVICAVAGIVSDVARLPSQPGVAATLALLVLGAAGVRVAARLPATLVAAAGIAVMVAGRVDLRGEYITAFVFLGVLAWSGALASGAWLRLLDIRRRLAIDTARRDERLELARELHDVVAHHISMIAVQAETARLATPGMPAAGAQRLSEIGDTARAGLTEMRRLLGVLREDAQAAMPGDQSTDRQPQPGLRQLNELLDGARDTSGAAARLIVSGPPAALDPGVELAAFRIIQEALTNARRHAPGAAIDVELHFTDDALLLRVRDNGPGPPAAPLAGGHGLAGMRERAAAAGGGLRTGPAPGGGFLIEATLPAKAEAAL